MEILAALQGYRGLSQSMIDKGKALEGQLKTARAGEDDNALIENMKAAVKWLRVSLDLS